MAILPILSVENLTKRFGGLVALDNVSFEVERGEALGIIGPNGAGKSTLLDLITGFQKPDSGRVLFKGRRINGLKPNQIVDEGVSRTFQLVRPFKHFTVLENIMVAMESRRARKARPETGRPAESACELAKLVALSENLFSLAGTLSQGSLKKLEIARALATKPEAALIDESLSGLSAGEASELVETITRVKQQRGLTLVMVEHNVSSLVKIVNRMIVLDYGKLLLAGSPEEVMRDERVVEAYLGKGSTGS